MNSSEYIQSGIIEAYVLGLCTPEEKAELEALRMTDKELDSAIVEFEMALEQKYMNDAIATSSATDDKILRALQETKKAPVVALQSTGKSKKNIWKYVAAAACGLLLISLYFNYTLYNKQNRIVEAKSNKNSLSANDFAVLTNESITPVAMYGVGTHAVCRCTMFWDKATKKAYFMMHHLVAPPPGKAYQVWAFVNGEPKSVGMINQVVKDRFIEVPNVPDNAIKFGITLEDEKGVTKPTLEELYLAGSLDA